MKRLLFVFDLDAGSRSVAVVLGILSMAVVLQGCGGTPIGPTGTESGTSASSSGCQGSPARPNYPVTALRWERFPIRVYIEEVELQRRGFPSGRISAISSLIMQGLGSWSAQTGGRVGGVVKTGDFNAADLNVVFRNNYGEAIHDTVTGSFIRHATILFDPNFPEGFADRDHRWVNQSAHEMGHVLGIVAHPTGVTGSIMVNEVEQLRYTGPQLLDVNSILVKYGFACS